MMELPQDMQGWLVLIARIALPIFILFVAFGPKIDAWLSSWGPVYSKKEMLKHWKVAQKSFKKDQKPSELSNLAMVTAETAPLLFQKPEVPDRTSKQKKKSEKVDKSEKVEKAEKMVEKSVIDKADTEDLAKTDKSTGQETTEEVKPDEAAKQMHFESLMNFMAFNRHQPQRVFLPVGDPPPPRKAGSKRPTITGTDARQANLEAQMVLQGALELELETPNKLLSGVARSLCDQLTRASVEIQAETFSLMVKACIKVMDLTSCSDFLCRIEAAGQVLDNTLMDHVMELYWDQKRRGPEPETEPANLAQEMGGAAYHGRPTPVHSMPEVFNQMAPGAWLSGGTAHRESAPSPSFDLPAFSVPEEFKAIPDSGSTLSSEAPEFRPEGLVSSGLSPEAAEFQPGLLQTTESYTFKAKGHKISNKTLPKTSPPVDTLQ